MANNFDTPSSTEVVSKRTVILQPYSFPLSAAYTASSQLECTFITIRLTEGTEGWLLKYGDNLSSGRGPRKADYMGNNHGLKLAMY